MKSNPIINNTCGFLWYIWQYRSSHDLLNISAKKIILHGSFTLITTSNFVGLCVYCGIRWLKFSIWFFHNISIKYEMLTGVCLFLKVIMIIIWPLRSSFHRYVHLVCDQWGSYDHWYMTVTIDHLTGNFSREKMISWYTHLSKLAHQILPLSNHIRH